MTLSSGLTWGKCLKNFFCRELLSAFRFFSFFSASLASLASLLLLGTISEEVSPFDEDFCEAVVDLSLSLPPLVAGDDEEGEWAFLEESLKRGRKKDES